MAFKGLGSFDTATTMEMNTVIDSAENFTRTEGKCGYMIPSNAIMSSVLTSRG